MSSQDHPQETAFITDEADAWFDRNAAAILKPASPDHRLLAMTRGVELPEKGSLVDIGGGTGHVSAGFLASNPGWRVKVVEASIKAIEAGHRAFPAIEFIHGSIAQVRWPDKAVGADLVIVSGVLCWVDRALLARAIANIDFACADGGYLAIADFDPPAPRANPYKHRPGLFTYKQDYPGIFVALGTYTLLLRESTTLPGHSKGNESDAYDQQWVTAILRKDLRGRY